MFADTLYATETWHLPCMCDQSPPEFTNIMNCFALTYLRVRLNTRFCVQQFKRSSINTIANHLFILLLLAPMWTILLDFICLFHYLCLCDAVGFGEIYRHNHIDIN